MEIQTDMHTHSAFSPDGISELEEMIETAYTKGIQYYGIAEHFNGDYVDALNKMIRPMNIDLYFHTARALQKKYSDKMIIAVGIEFGYTNSQCIWEFYKDIESKFRPDFVINSVHSVSGLDYCLLSQLMETHEAINSYLQLVRNSIDSPYYYDIIGHLGYVLRYIKEDVYNTFFDDYHILVDDILKRIIDRNKILEVNTSTYGLGQNTLPDEIILSRYYSLGGRKVSFGSDAHDVKRVGDKWKEVKKLLNRIGFRYLTVPFCGENLDILI